MAVKRKCRFDPTKKEPDNFVIVPGGKGWQLTRLRPTPLVIFEANGPAKCEWFLAAYLELTIEYRRKLRAAVA